MPIKILVADDQTLIRKGICSLLQLSEKVTIVGEACNGSEVLKEIPLCHPDILLLDIQMPQMDGIETLNRMRAESLEVPTIILTTFDDSELVLKGMKNGAKGFLLKDVSLDRLIDAIECVHQGGSYVQPVITEKILKGFTFLKSELKNESYSSISPELTETLSEKEVEVLRLIAAGYSNHDIALMTHKTEGTVKNQVSSILNKLGVKDRVKAILRAIELGLIG